MSSNRPRESEPSGGETESDASGRETGSESTRGNDGRSGDASWLLLTGDRLRIAGIALGVVLAMVVALEALLGFPSVRSSSPIYFLFSSLVTGNLTLITVVLSINQVVLSRELGAPGTLSERIRGSMEFRDEVEETVDTGVSPNSPEQFLRFLHENIGTSAGELADATADVTDGGLTDRLTDLADSLDRDVETVNRTLEGSDGNVFDVVSATLATNHASQLHEIAAIRAEYRDALPDDVADALDAIEAQLLQIDVGRKYFKTVYVQKELAYLSRVLLYVGVPAVVVDSLVLVFYNALGPVPVPSLVVYGVVTVSFVAGLAPLAVLFAFILRLAWVGQRTATVAPFSSESEFRA